MSTKHTPGPWKLYREECDAWDRVEVSPIPDHRYICVEGLTREQAQANARLIASAPDLLEALKELVDANDDAAHPQWKGSPVENMARAAIAKATGESA